MNQVHTFDISIKGEISGKLYEGKFVYRHPTLADKLKIRSLESKMTSQYDYHPEIAAINYTLAYLEISLIECPDWFKESKYGLNLVDEIILDVLSEKIKLTEAKKYEAIIKEMEKDKKGNQDDTANESSTV